jgi:hypothetical protein
LRVTVASVAQGSTRCGSTCWPNVHLGNSSSCSTADTFLFFRRSLKSRVCCGKYRSCLFYWSLPPLDLTRHRMTVHAAGQGLEKKLERVLWISFCGTDIPTPEKLSFGAAGQQSHFGHSLVPPGLFHERIYHTSTLMSASVELIFLSHTYCFSIGMRDSWCRTLSGSLWICVCRSARRGLGFCFSES